MFAGPNDVWFSADRRSRVSYDRGTGIATLYVEGVAALQLNATQVIMPLSIGSLPSLTVTGAITATAINVLTTARLLGNNQIGATTASLIGFYGVTPVGQPAHTAQSALSTGAVTGLAVTATAIATTGVVAGFQSLADVTALLTNFNALRTQVDAQGSMLNAIRNAITSQGIIKGSI